MRIQKELECLRPFIECADGLIPVRKIKRIRGFKIPLQFMEAVDGALIKDIDSRYIVTLRTYNIRAKRIGKRSFKQTRHQAAYLENLLHTLAHELAHIRHWEHTPEHFLLMSRIQKRFYKVLKTLNVKDTYQTWKKELANGISRQSA